MVKKSLNDKNYKTGNNKTFKKQGLDLIKDRVNWIFTKKRIETLADNLNTDTVEIRKVLSSHSALIWSAMNSVGDELTYGWNFLRVLSSGRCPVGIAVFKEKDGTLSIPIKNNELVNGRLRCNPKDRKIRGACIKRGLHFKESQFRKHVLVTVEKNPRNIQKINQYYTTDVIVDDNGRKRRIPYSYAFTLISVIK